MSEASGMSLVSEVRRKVKPSCCKRAVRQGKDKQLWVDLSGEPGDWLVVKLDGDDSPMDENKKRPDFLFVSDTRRSAKSQEQAGPGRLSPIEVSKGKAKKMSEIRPQLQACADWVAQTIDTKFHPRLVPVYLGALGRHEQMELRLKRSQVRFRGQSQIIQRMNSGQPLPDPD